jgi:hypothetical protein
VPAQVLDSYAGKYRVEAPEMVTRIMGDTLVFIRDGEHFFASGKQGRAEVFAESQTAFYSKVGSVKVSFIPAAAGKDTQAILSLMGLREFPLRRAP